MSQSVTNINSAKSIPAMLKELPPGQRKIIDAVLTDIGRNLIQAFPEMNAGVSTDNGQSSFSPTLEIKPAKKGRWKASLKYRVRTPRESTEFEMHLDDDNQLSFGEPTGGWDESEPATTGRGGGDDGFDD